MAVTDRGQAFTLEAFVAALVLLACVAFALHVTGVTPATSSTADDRLEAHHAGLAAGVLDAAVANDSLRPTLLYWNETSETFHGAAEDHYVSRHPPTAFGQHLAWAVGERPVRYNVNVHYEAADGDIRTQRLVHHGTPSDDAVRVTEWVTLYDDDRLYAADGTERSVSLAESAAFYAPDAAPDSPVYNVVRVEVVVWRA